MVHMPLVAFLYLQIAHYETPNSKIKPAAYWSTLLTESGYKPVGCRADEQLGTVLIDESCTVWIPWCFNSDLTLPSWNTGIMSANLRALCEQAETVVFFPLCFQCVSTWSERECKPIELRGRRTPWGELCLEAVILLHTAKRGGNVSAEHVCFHICISKNHHCNLIRDDLFYVNSIAKQRVEARLDLTVHESKHLSEIFLFFQYKVCWMYKKSLSLRI